MKNSKTRISKLTIGRLYNLGNYEHVRYELTVEIPPASSVTTALRNTMTILRAANPKPPVTDYDIQHAKAQLSDPQSWHKDIKDPKERKPVLSKMVKDARQVLAKFKRWQNRRQQAEQLLDNLGAVRQFKDAKLTWDTEDDY